MKTLKYLALGFLAIAGLTLQSCSDSDDYDVKGDPRTFIYVDFNTPRLLEFNVTHTPVGHFGDIQASFPVKIQYTLEGPTEVKLEADNSLVAAYNAENGTDYQACPEEVLAGLELTNTIIPAGSYEGAEPLTVTLPNEYFQYLTEEAYVLPLRATSFVKKDVRGSEEYGIVYLVIKTSGDEGFFSTRTASSTIVRTPVGVVGTISNNFTVGLQNALTSDVVVTGIYDSSLITTYNAEHSTNYQELPEAVRNELVITPATIAAEATTGQINISLTDPTLAQQLEEEGYVYPIRLQLTYSSGDVVLQEEEIAYLVVTTKYDIFNDNGSFGSEIDLSGAVCISATNYNPADFTPSGWNPSTLRVASASFVLDLGSEKTITGFGVDSYVQNSYKVYLSTDNSNWLELDYTGHSGKNNSNWTTCYFIYNLPARYVRVEQVMNPNSWAWSYANWGYCGTDIFLYE